MVALDPHPPSQRTLCTLAKIMTILDDPLAQVVLYELISSHNTQVHFPININSYRMGQIVFLFYNCGTVFQNALCPFSDKNRR